MVLNSGNNNQEIKIMSKLYDLYILTNNSAYQYADFEDKDIYLPEALIKIKSFSNQDIFNKRINLKNIWKSIDIELIKRDVGKRLRVNPDILETLHMKMFSEKSLEYLKDLIPENVEILPVNNISSDKKYYILNFTSDIDCLTDKSELDASGFVITDIKKYDFELSKVTYDMFKIKKIPDDIYVTKKFIEKVMESNLKGFCFIPIWSSETGGIENPTYSEIAGVDKTQEWIKT